MSQKLPSGFELHGIVWGPFTDVFLINYLHSFQVVLLIVFLYYEVEIRKVGQFRAVLRANIQC